MINGSSVIAIVPARSGSKGLPGKNIKELCGKPLIAWTIEKALMSSFIDRVVVSTDSEEIAEIAVRFGADVPFLRPKELASDEATSCSVVEHCLDFFEFKNNLKFDYTLLLEPTSPLRQNSDIDRAITLLDSQQGFFDAVISLGIVSEHPSIVKSMIGETVYPYLGEIFSEARRQDLSPTYFPYGGIYASKSKSILDSKSFYPIKCGAIVVEPYQCLEIDNEIDFVCVEAIMRKFLSFD
jgi:CMP-N-acetylneuraminic acid synthetase